RAARRGRPRHPALLRQRLLLRALLEGHWPAVPASGAARAAVSRADQGCRGGAGRAAAGRRIVTRSPATLRGAVVGPRAGGRMAKRGLRAVAGWVVATATLLWTLLALLPLQPWSFDATLDGAYPLALSAAFARGAHFGTDVIFTFGPFGFLYRPHYHPATYHVLMV